MKQLFTLLFVATLSTFAFSQEESAPAEEPKLEVSGFVDVYFHFWLFVLKPDNGLFKQFTNLN